MSVEPQNTPLSHRSRTPTRHQPTLVGILGTPPADYRVDVQREIRTPSRSPIRQQDDEVTKLQNKFARTIKDTVVFRSELSDSPFIGGKRNPNYANKSFLSSEALVNPEYESAEKVDQKPHFRPGSRHRKTHKEPVGSITRPIDYPYLSPHKITPRRDHRAANEELFRKLEFEEVQAVKKPVSAVKTSVPQEVPVQSENKYLTYEYQEEERHQTPTRRGVLTPRKEQNVQTTLQVETPSSRLKKATKTEEITHPQSARDISPVAQRFRDTQLTPSKIPRNQSLQKVSLDSERLPRTPKEDSYAAIHQGGKPSPLRKVDTSPLRKVDTSMEDLPYYLKRRLERSQTPEISAREDGKERSLTPTQRAKTPTEVKKPEYVPKEMTQPTKTEVPEAKTPVSQQSQGSNGSNASGKSLVCDKCVNKLLAEEKHDAQVHDREDARIREQELARLNKELLEHDREKEIAKKEEARKGALVNREILNQKENERLARRRNPPTDQMRHLDKIFESEEKIARDRLNKSADFRDVLRSQIEEKRREKEMERAREKSPEFGTSINISGEWKNPRVPSVRDLSEELKNQIQQKEKQKREALQRDKERARVQAELVAQMAKEDQILAKEKEKQKREELKGALEQAIKEKRAHKEQAKNAKYEDHDQIIRIQTFARDEEERQKEARKTWFDDHLRGLQKQIDEVQRKKREEKEKSREPYETAIRGVVDHSPDFIQQKKAVEREILKDQLLNQIEEKRAERQKQKERDVQTGVSIPIENNYKNPYLDYSKPLAQILKEQIESKLQEKERQAREAKELARQSDLAAARMQQDIEQQAREQNRERREALKNALLQEINSKERLKESKQSEKKKDLELVTALNQSYREDLDRSRRKEENARHDHTEALKKQIRDRNEMKEREKSEGKLPYDVTLTGVVNRNRDPKLYSCMECTQKFPKYRMTKKKQLKIL